MACRQEHAHLPSASPSTRHAVNRQLQVVSTNIWQRQRHHPCAEMQAQQQDRPVRNVLNPVKSLAGGVFTLAICMAHRFQDCNLTCSLVNSTAQSLVLRTKQLSLLTFPRHIHRSQDAAIPDCKACYHNNLVKHFDATCSCPELTRICST